VALGRQECKEQSADHEQRDDDEHHKRSRFDGVDGVPRFLATRLTGDE
jgi:hypothetical protein